MADREIPLTVVLLPLNSEMAETLKKLLSRAVVDGHGQIEISISYKEVRIVDRMEHRFTWSG